MIGPFAYFLPSLCCLKTCQLLYTLFKVGTWAGEKMCSATRFQHFARLSIVGPIFRRTAFVLQGDTR